MLKTGNLIIRITKNEDCSYQTGSGSFWTRAFPACHCHNKKHVYVPLPTAYINAYSQDTGLTGCFTVETSNFASVAFL